MGLDASHAQGRAPRPAGSQNPRGQKATGRTGLDLWQILVLGVVRRGLDADWDRMEHVANYDLLVRQMLGLPATPWDDESKMFSHQTLRDNVALLDDALLQQINARSAAAGREVFAKKSRRAPRGTGGEGGHLASLKPTFTSPPT